MCQVTEMTESQLDELALTGESIPSWFAPRGDEPVSDRHGYRFHRVATGGCGGNWGFWVLTGRTQWAREHVREGQVSRIMRLTGLAREDAGHLYDAASRVKYGMEDAVLRYAAETRLHPAWDVFPGVGNGVGRWSEKNHMPAGLSCPRLAAVATIVQKWARRK